MTTNIFKNPTSCFSVIEPENERGEIIFADTDEQAIAIYILRQGDDEFPDLDTIRAIEHPEWARYASEKAVPIIEQIRSGHWSYECDFCLATISADQSHEDTTDEPVVWPTNHTFCSCFCAAGYISRRLNHNIMDTAAREWICDEITAHCPDKTIINVSTNTTETTIRTIRAAIAETADPSQIAFARIDFPENSQPAIFTLQTPHILEGETVGYFDNLDIALQTIISRTTNPMTSTPPISWADRITNYVSTTKMPNALFEGDSGHIVGTWIMGNNYRVKSTYYGGYPAGYLKRIKALFPDKTKALHLFSGKVDTEAFPGDRVDLNPDLDPTYLDDAQTLTNVPLGEYDIVLADPPYSIEDCQHYGTTMVKRNKVMAALSRLPSGAHVVWLDQVLPMYRKDTFKLEAAIGMLKSTNHRFRIITIFRRL